MSVRLEVLGLTQVYDSMLALSMDLQVARAILIISILVCVVGTLASIAGATFTNCLAESFRTKARVALAAGVLFLVAGVWVWSLPAGQLTRRLEVERIRGSTRWRPPVTSTAMSRPHLMPNLPNLNLCSHPMTLD
ncbi:claudin-like protein ZF-A9 isoform X1 [Esox lucius]|uniref:claudin-like protein ZF-A9 isoform X1 n=1 Tax=Esox lucius TaxID=8010 RepID=UPI001476E2C6|nr:claudin-like protein ZF-A9 isoform X1 [Esox lucius]